MSGSEQLRRIAARSRALADGGIKRESIKVCRAAAQPLPAAVKAAAGRDLPQRGGLAARVAAERVSISVITAGPRAGVRLTQANHDARATNAGYVRHPYFGRWVENSPKQQIPGAAGWWSKTLSSRAPAAAVEIHAGLSALLSTIGA